MTEFWEAFWLPIIIGTILGSVGGVWAYINRRGGQRFQQRNPLPPTWPEMWARQDAQDKRIRAQDEKIDALNDTIKDLQKQIEAKDRTSQVRDRAITNILLAASRQWPAGTPGPVFDKRDTDVLGDTMPSDWIKRSRMA